ncbi:heme biosynthesis HemY N-terminal domain-containing protein [Candidatus Williamhamiltonella defendens]|uniref:Protoheme IX synthesis protein n=1 Tax=Candidatus Williamhamiltonella defendens TaxID=138072 RepID=A0A2D3TDC6_9ENTR|nr:heme biosynthesis HemY N-terminal domain-containing protein [Candidatus Hamiltonella defensa]ATW33521.1 protoheme IX synthesis protein [Candidatus Hamiltonella defensa]AYB48441.1 protoheme IX synthesis protein [Candidatus Hamiltonella defensa]
MWRILLSVFFPLVAIVSFLVFSSDQGYVLIRVDHYDIETTVTGMIILLVTFFLFFFFITQFLKSIFNLRRRFIHRKSLKQEKEALIKFLEGDFQKVETKLMSQIKQAENPIFNYLLAAMAAEKESRHADSDQYLAQAEQYIKQKFTGRKQAEKNRLTLNITRVRIQLSRGDIDLAQTGIYPLLKKAPEHPEVLRLAEKIFLQTKSYPSLLKILPVMRKMRLHPENEIQALEQKLHRSLPTTTTSGSKRRLKSD